jgi:hypothetical protein
VSLETINGPASIADNFWDHLFGGDGR